MSREDKRYLIEVHVAGICFRFNNSQAEVLIAKRSSKKEIFPELWECGGGQVSYNENFEEAIVREMKEELGIIVKDIIPFTVYEIFMPDYEQKKIPGVRFYCFFDSYINNSGPIIDSKDFSEFKWAKEEELNNYDFVPGLLEDIKNAIKIINLKF